MHVAAKNVSQEDKHKNLSALHITCSWKAKEGSPFFNDKFL